MNYSKKKRCTNFQAQSTCWTVQQNAKDNYSCQKVKEQPSKALTANRSTENEADSEICPLEQLKLSQISFHAGTKTSLRNCETYSNLWGS